VHMVSSLQEQMHGRGKRFTSCCLVQKTQITEQEATNFALNKDLEP
jgi:hypothetical protein